MIPTNDLSIFIKKNDQDVRCMVAQICESFNYHGSIEDIVQDIYLKVITYKIVESYDPDFYGEDTVKMSTFIYHIIKNHIISCLKSPQNRLVRYQLSDCDSAEANEIDLIINRNTVAEETQNIIHNNECSDSIEGLGAELRDFEKRFNKSKNNKKYTLGKRKFKNKDRAYNFLKKLSESYMEENSEELKEIKSRIENIDETGCTLLDIFRLLYKGYNNKQIAQIYSVSNMSITNMKHRLAKEMMKYGFGKKAPVFKSGNGHKKAKIRDLTESERNVIRSDFITVNGQIEEDACHKIKEKLDPVVSIFQITGIIVQLHREVAIGKIKMVNMRSYKRFIRKHRQRWATYNSDKYKKMRKVLLSK